MVVRLASSILSGLAATVHMAKHHFGAMVNNWRLAYCCIYPILAMCQVSGVCVKVARLKEGGRSASCDILLCHGPFLYFGSSECWIVRIT